LIYGTEADASGFGAIAFSARGCLGMATRWVGIEKACAGDTTGGSSRLIAMVCY